MIDLLAETTVDSMRISITYQRQLMYYFAELILGTRKKRFGTYLRENVDVKVR
ncbi:MAG: hypothetical protein IC227_01130 [Enterococcus lacertideformus]|uniref:Uncharacterized protein n=1 Tax=Enterococcus lacertideformus TaxID=2771493 RepID=A0A931AYM9_9ENTE|nr:hypothetical protein [Enterococcus lacertideformus]